MIFSEQMPRSAMQFEKCEAVGIITGYLELVSLMESMLKKLDVVSCGSWMGLMPKIGVHGVRDVF